MSAIYGEIDLLGNKIDGDQAKLFEDYYGKFAIDKINTISLEEGNGFMGCGIQYFNEEAKEERLPVMEDQLLFTADAVVDNADGLDSAFILENYKNNGMEGIAKLRGAFAYAIYKKEENKVILAVDHFSQRCLFYHVRDGRVYFSTLMFPLLRLTGLEFAENERWIVDSISLRAPVMITEPKETAVEKVYKVVSGSYVEITLDKNGEVFVNEVCYYDPAKGIKVDKSITLEDSEKMIRDTMNLVESRILRMNVKIGTQLSCGLDSSSVACIAAKQLAERGEKLYSYTSIPDKAAGLENRGGAIYDETEGVMEICKAYPNIEPSFVDTADRNYLLETESIVEKWEAPCKSQQNAIWIDEIAKRASDNGCKILLAGSTGNCTISAGDVLNSAVYYLKHFQLIKAYHIFDECKVLGVSRKRLFKGMLKKWLGYYRWYFDSEERDCYRYIATKKSIGEKHKLTRRFHRDYFHYYPFSNMQRMHFEMYMPNANAQIGEIDTKISLQYGIITRDPMRTPEIVELCLKLPMECFAANDYDRRLVRVGMEGVVPEKIRYDVLRRGRQSGDNIYKASKVWKEIEPDLKATLYSESYKPYLDKAILDSYFEKIDKDGFEANALDVLLLIDLYSMGKYRQLLNK